MADTRTTILEATITVIAQLGYTDLSIRNVAAEANVAIGAVQYHFRTKEHLLIGAQEMIVARQMERIRNLPPSANPVEVIRHGLTEILPVDAKREAESRVWIALATAAQRDSSIAELQRQHITLSQQLLTNALKYLHKRGMLHPSLDPATAANILIAMADGLTFDFVNAPPEGRPTMLAALNAAIDLVILE